MICITTISSKKEQISFKKDVVADKKEILTAIKQGLADGILHISILPISDIHPKKEKPISTKYELYIAYGPDSVNSTAISSITIPVDLSTESGVSEVVNRINSNLHDDLIEIKLTPLKDGVPYVPESPGR